jgi:type II secretory pathway pseudopilin PulG
MIGAGSLPPHGDMTPGRIGDARGFTLVETLVAMVSGLAVMLALFAILEFSTRQASRATDITQATQLGRSAMTHLIDELHSTCQVPKQAPILEKSKPSELWFENTVSEAAVIESAARHRIYWVEKEKGGSLWEATWNSTGGVAGEFTFPSTATTPSTTVLLGQNISHYMKTVSGKTEEVPFFQYYKYATTAGAIEAGKPVSTLELTTPPSEGLTAVEAKEVASVLVSFRSGPVDGKSELGRTVDLASQATFSFSAPVAEATIKDGPCQ